MVFDFKVFGETPIYFEDLAGGELFRVAKKIDNDTFFIKIIDDSNVNAVNIENGKSHFFKEYEEVERVKYNLSISAV